MIMAYILNKVITLCFKHFHKALGLADKDAETQVDTLIYRLGNEADDILWSFSLLEEDML